MRSSFLLTFSGENFLFLFIKLKVWVWLLKGHAVVTRRSVRDLFVSDWLPCQFELGEDYVHNMVDFLVQRLCGLVFELLVRQAPYVLVELTGLKHIVFQRRISILVFNSHF